MSKQKVAIFGALGKTGNSLITEALRRKHKVTAIVYDESKVVIKHPDLKVVYGHMMNADNVENLVKGHDAVIGVHEPLLINPNEHIKAIRSVIDGTKKAGIRKILIIAHPIYKPIENTLEFYDSWKPIAWAQREGLKLFQRESYLNWAYVYSDKLEPDTRTGRLDKKENMILATPTGENQVPLKNYASFLLDKTIIHIIHNRMELEFHI
jgi:putative NADH-flavin reductase